MRLSKNRAPTNVKDRKIVEILKILTNRHGCHTVILYGSRARGDAGTASDYDLLGIKTRGPAFRDARRWKNVYLDLFVYPERHFKVLDESMLQFRGGLVLIEKNSAGIRLLHRLNKYFEKGPKKLPLDEIQARKVWAQKMLDRASEGDLEANFRRLWLSTALLEDYFRLRGQWYSGSKESFKWLARNDPETLRLFTSVLRNEAAPGPLKRLVERVIR